MAWVKFAICFFLGFFGVHKFMEKKTGMPFILDDKRRSRYLEGIREWDDDPGILGEVVMEAQSRFDAQIQLQMLAEHRQSFLPVGFMED